MNRPVGSMITGPDVCLGSSSEVAWGVPGRNEAAPEPSFIFEGDRDGNVYCR